MWMFNPPCPCCDDTRCRPRLCVRLFDPCQGRTVGHWRLVITAPDGATVAFDSDVDAADEHGQSLFLGVACVDARVYGAGTYTFHATLTRDLTPWNGPSSHAMAFDGQATVLDVCDVPGETRLEVCEDWLAVRFRIQCGGACLSGTTSVSVTSPIGSATLETGEFACFTGFDCLDSAYDSIDFVATPVSGNWTGTATFRYPRCDPGGTDSSTELDSANIVAIILDLHSGSPLLIAGGAGPASGFVCSACDGPIPRTMHYSDSTGMTAGVTYDDTPLSPTFGKWVGSGVGISPDAAELNPYDHCCDDNPGGPYRADLLAEPDCVDGFVVWKIRKDVWHCGHAIDNSVSGCGYDDDLCPSPGTTEPSLISYPGFTGIGQAGPVPCDPFGMAATGTMQCVNDGGGPFACCPLEAQADWMLTV
jgi:hypothetical protein